MQYQVNTAEEYIDHIPEERKQPFQKIRTTINKNLPQGFEEGILYKMLGWFVSEYPKHCKRKLDMGKSCVRFKYMDDIPYELIAVPCSKMTADQWITIYETKIKQK